MENLSYCFLNHRADVNNIIFSSNHELFKVIGINPNNISVLCKPLMYEGSNVYVNSYKVLVKAKLIENKNIINKHDAFFLPEPPYPFDLIYFVELKDYTGKYQCTDCNKVISGIDSDIILSSCCEFTKSLNEEDVLSIKSIISEW